MVTSKSSISSFSLSLKVIPALLSAFKLSVGSSKALARVFDALGIEPPSKAAKLPEATIALSNSPSTIVPKLAKIAADCLKSEADPSVDTPKSLDICCIFSEVIFTASSVAFKTASSLKTSASISEKALTAAFVAKPKAVIPAPKRTPPTPTLDKPVAINDNLPERPLSGPNIVAEALEAFLKVVASFSLPLDAT